MISIHAPLTGSDTEQPASSRMSIYFNPRSPYGERLENWGITNAKKNFNPRSPYGERRMDEEA